MLDPDVALDLEGLLEALECLDMLSKKTDYAFECSADCEILKATGYLFMLALGQLSLVPARPVSLLTCSATVVRTEQPGTRVRTQADVRSITHTGQRCAKIQANTFKQSLLGLDVHQTSTCGTQNTA